MKTCNNCGNQNEGHLSFCKSCGSSLDAMTQQPAQMPPPGAPLPNYPLQDYSQQGHPSQQNPNQGYSQQGYQQQQNLHQGYPPPPPPPPGYHQHGHQPYGYQQPGVQHVHSFLKLGGWLLFWVIFHIALVVFDIIASLGEITETIDLLRRMDTIGHHMPDGFVAATYISFLGQAVGLLTIVFTIIFIVQVFQRNPAFLRSFQIFRLAGIFYAIFAGIIPTMMIGGNVVGAEMVGFLIGSTLGSVAGLFLITLYFCKSKRVRIYMGSDEYMSKAIFAFKDQPPLQRPPYNPYS